MKLEDVLPALREGKSINRKEYPDTIIFSKFSFEFYTIDVLDLLADDWEVEDE